MNGKSVMGGLCPVGRPSVKDTSQKKKVVKDQEKT